MNRWEPEAMENIHAFIRRVQQQLSCDSLIAKDVVFNDTPFTVNVLSLPSDLVKIYNLKRTYKRSMGHYPDESD